VAEPGEGDRPARRTFAPVVLLGLASAALAAVASAKPWLGAPSPAEPTTDSSMTALDAGTHYPLASAVSLVLLAAWGVLLVTRGRVRRVFAVLALVAAVGLVVTVVTAYFTMPDSAGGSYDELLGRSAQDTGFTAWFWTAAVASVVAVVPAALAVRLAPTWPEMGSRYDAPTGAASTAPETVETDLDLWHALDDGRDPTDRPQS
jgi:uncharacterized membrane protein (TIGR02234 family)